MISSLDRFLVVRSLALATNATLPHRLVKNNESGLDNPRRRAKNAFDGGGRHA
jgi:hypothetical protein